MQPQTLAYLNEGNALVLRGRFVDSLVHYDRAISIEPECAQAYANKAVVLAHMGESAAALACCEHALALKPDFPLAWSNRGNILQQDLKLEAALDSYDRAIALDPVFADAYWNKANALLLGGNFEQGLPLYEWRWMRPNFTSPRRNFSKPLWMGADSLAGKTILLHSEQGLGDTLQFCRYAAMVEALGARVILEVQPTLQGLLHSLDGVSACVAKGATLPAFDVHCPLLSLPLAFKTHMDTIPSSPCYLASKPARHVFWVDKLGLRTRPLVGIVWSGRSEHAHDKQRSISLDLMLQWLPEVFDYVSLQKDVRENDVAALRVNKGVRHFGAELTDFEDTAALCDCVDLVVSVDTSVAHLSAALGKPTWILLPYCPDWRWQLHRSDSPWYPSATLYRQEQPGAWSEVLRRVATDLTQYWLARQTCPVCKGSTSVLEPVDFHKSCQEVRGNAFEPSGLSVHYCLCNHCGFCFAPEIGAWTPHEFAQRIYNDDYPLVDPDAAEKRPRANASLLQKMFGDQARGLRHLDFGGGAGLLSRLLSDAHWNSSSFDPFSEDLHMPPADVSELGRFDLITAFEVFEHVPDPHKLFATLTKLLAPGGLVILSTQLSDGNLQTGRPLTWWYASPRNGHISLYSRASLVFLAQHYGVMVLQLAEGLFGLCTDLPVWARCLVQSPAKGV